MDEPRIDLRYVVPTEYTEYEEPDRHLWSVSADIVLYKDEEGEDDETFKREPIGHVGATVYMARAAFNDGESIIVAADARAQEEYEIAEYIYNDEFEACRWMQVNLSSGWGSQRNAIYIDRLWLEPKHRGSDLGLQAIRHMLRRFGYGCDAAVLQPVPLVRRPDGAWGPMAKGNERNEATRKLRAYYRRVGFVPAGRSGLMVADLANNGAIRIKSKKTASKSLHESANA